MFENFSQQSSEKEQIDILEDNIYKLSPHLLDRLLQDKTKSTPKNPKNIVWACDEYAKYGEAYTAEKEILPELITKDNTRIIQPRISKTKDEQINRTRKSAEVFTPSWICNEMNNHCDEEWFGRKNVFNIPNGHDWTSTAEPIQFKENKKHKTPSWQKYVKSRRLEITCGEAPYLVSRYDTTTGEFLPIEKRIGLLDRKLRIVNENTTNETDWFNWAKRAFEATYGYEYQGDNLLLARENLLWTFIDNFKFKHKKQPTLTQIKQIANVIAWNIWQMDGLTDTVPFATLEENENQLELFDDLPKIYPPCTLQNQRLATQASKRNHFQRFERNKKMKFDVVIGNPPYQLNVGVEQESYAIPLYHKFIQQAKKLNPRFLTMIIPARWYAGGRGLDEFRDEMLNDKRIRIIHDFPDSGDCFPGVEVKGGVCYFLWDRDNAGLCEISTHSGDKIISSAKRKLLEDGNDTFIRYNPSISVLQKVRRFNEESFAQLVSPQTPFGIISSFKEYEKFAFKDAVKIYITKGEGYINKYQVVKNKNLIDEYKIYITKSYGAGEGFPHQILNKPFFGDKNTCCSQTYLVIGPFPSKKETDNAMKYISTRFFRFMVMLKKNTQDAMRGVYQFVPLQDFNESWTDEKLYKKYGLTQEEIDFIESMIKPME